MLTQLTIHNIVLIEQLTIPFSRGLCVLTGETGAGKSILLDALHFALGERSNPRLLKSGATQGMVTAEFDISAHRLAMQFLEDQGLPKDGVLYLRRSLAQDGKSKAFINDVPVSVNLLKSLGELLVEIHGQHDQRGLLEAATHRAIIDAYGDNAALREEVRAAFTRWREAEEACIQLKTAQESASREEDYLRHIEGELRELSPEEGEESTLAEKRSLLLNREKLLDTVKTVYNGLEGETDLAQILYSVQRLLMRATTQVPEGTMEPIIDSLERAMIEINDAKEAVNRLSDQLGGKEASLEEVEERLFALRAAARKFHRPCDELPGFLEEIQHKLSLIGDNSARMDILEKQALEAKSSYVASSRLLTQQRLISAEKLEKALLQELRPLKMDGARFKVMIEALPEESWSAHGMDKVHFMASMNAGTPMGALAKIASGGELSRFMLAVKVVLSKVNATPTLIFDEIDTGIGGAVADSVGKRLALLGKNVDTRIQVLVVTHQPQVAAYGNYHLKVIKSQKGDKTETAVIVLPEAARQEELARMLAGEHITAEARAAAERLLKENR